MAKLTITEIARQTGRSRQQVHRDFKAGRIKPGSKRAVAYLEQHRLANRAADFRTTIVKWLCDKWCDTLGTTPLSTLFISERVMPAERFYGEFSGDASKAFAGVSLPTKQVGQPSFLILDHHAFLVNVWSHDLDTPAPPIGRRSHLYRFACDTEDRRLLPIWPVHIFNMALWRHVALIDTADTSSRLRCGKLLVGELDIETDQVVLPLALLALVAGVQASTFAAWWQALPAADRQRLEHARRLPREQLSPLWRERFTVSEQDCVGLDDTILSTHTTSGVASWGRDITCPELVVDTEDMRLLWQRKAGVAAWQCD